jgi:hypothetical protein
VPDRARSHRRRPAPRIGIGRWGTSAGLLCSAGAIARLWDRMQAPCPDNVRLVSYASCQENRDGRTGRNTDRTGGFAYESVCKAHPAASRDVSQQVADLVSARSWNEGRPRYSCRPNRICFGQETLGFIHGSTRSPAKR